MQSQMQSANEQKQRFTVIGTFSLILALLAQGGKLPRGMGGYLSRLVLCCPGRPFFRMAQGQSTGTSEQSGSAVGVCNSRIAFMSLVRGHAMQSFSCFAEYETPSPSCHNTVFSWGIPDLHEGSDHITPL